MATELNPTALRGMLIRDSRFVYANLDTSFSDYDESGHEPGQPTPDTQGYQALHALGTLTSDVPTTFDVVTQSSGAAIGGDEGGRFVWKYDAGASTTYRGWLNHNKVTGFGWIRFVSSGDGYTNPHGLSTAQHRAVVVHTNELSAGVNASYKDADDTAWTHVVVTSTGAWLPAIVAVPDNAAGQRLICLYLRSDYTEGATTYYTLGSSYSDDQGATWTLQRTRLAGWKLATSSQTVERIRAVYHSGFITILLSGLSGGGVPEMIHLVSTDLGCSLTQVETLTGGGIGTGRYSWDVVADSTGRVVAFYGLTSASYALHYATKPTPFSTFAGSADYDTQVSAQHTVDDDNTTLTACVDGEGYIWVYSTIQTNTYSVAVSRLHGETLQLARDTWLMNDLATNWPINCGNDSAEYLRRLCAFPWKDRILLCHNQFTSDTTDEALGATELGGYSSLDWPIQTFGRHADSGSPYDSGILYLPFALPSTVTVWTVGAAGGSEALDSDGLVLSTTASQQYYTRSGPGGASAGRPMLVWARVKVTSGGVLTGDDVALRLVRDNGTDLYSVSIRLRLNAGNMEIRLWDNNAAAQLGSDATGLGADFLDLLAAVSGTTAAVYYKLPTDTLWTAIITNTTLGAAATGSGANVLQWGHRATGTATSKWRFLGSCLDSEAANPGIANFTNPTDLQGRAFSPRPLWLGQTEGFQIAARGGAAFAGDAWTVTTRARHSARHLHPEISPSRDAEWRSPDTASNQIFAWSPNSGSGSRMLSSSIGIVVVGFNAKLSYLEGHVVGSGSPGTWTTLITLGGVSTISSSALTGSLSGNWLTPASGTNAALRYLQGGELIGGYAFLSWTGGGGGSGVYEILDNSEGVWRDPASARAVEILLDGNPAASGTITVEILPPALVGVAHGVTAAYDRYRWRIPSGQDTAEGYYKAGMVVVGPLLLFGQQYSRGRVLALEPAVETFELRGGLPVVRALGRPRRQVSFSWVEGVDTSQVYAASPDPDYLTARDASSYTGIATRADTHLLSGYLHRTRGEGLVTYLPALDPASGAAPSVHVYSGPERFLLGWCAGPVTVQALQGSEHSSEVHAINEIVIREAG